jgi:hypothetical protein
MESSETSPSWRHPHRGLGPPDEFIPAAERSFHFARPLDPTGIEALIDNDVDDPARRQRVYWGKSA